MGHGLSPPGRRYVEVALQARTARVGHLLTYAVPADWAVVPGQVVWVPLQRRADVGVVVGVTDRRPAFPTREILAVLTPEPPLALFQLELARWIAGRYACAVADALFSFLPPDARRAPRIAPAEGALDRLRELSAGRALLAALGRRRSLDLATAARAAMQPGLAALLRAGLVVSCSPALPCRQAALPPLELDPATSTLEPAQEGAFDAIRQAIDAAEPASFLLHGVTGSGKTHVYLHAVRHALSLGRQALVLVSDISLVPAAEQRFGEWFPGRTAVVHSERTPVEQRESWRRIAAGEARVVIGARSALFAPLRDLGLIVVDEEHETAYKQVDGSPTYHAREVALELGRLTGAPVVLGSATPDVCTYERALRGEHQLLRLPQRYTMIGAGPGEAAAGGELPHVQIVDLRAELAAGNSGMFSSALLSALTQVLDVGDQAILFLNRRGTATCVTCRECGHTVTCPDCLLPMIYHGDLDLLLCHHCNRRRRPPARCPGCGGARIRYLGVGTQRVEDEVRHHFPAARLLRWDRDTAARRGAHARMWEAFSRGEADVLVGTQMVAKALDFPRVTLVGVVLADGGLHLPDYRAAERSFQLLTQVAGRAGRGTRAGRVIVQTYTPQHYAIQAARQHHYEAFAERELAFRAEHAYPPYRRLARLIYAAPDEVRCWRECGRVLRALRARIASRGPRDAQVFGPAPAYFRRLRGEYRWQVLVSAAAPERLLADYRFPTGWTVDVDPVSVL
jgi:primosomal protein N' (replication factor Y)